MAYQLQASVQATQKGKSISRSVMRIISSLFSAHFCLNRRHNLTIHVYDAHEII